MGSLKALLLAGAAAILVPAAASAADLLPPPAPVDSPMPAVAADFGGGWYLRGDIGVGLDRSVKLRNVPDPMTQGGPGYVPTAYDLSKANVSPATFISFGYGYQFNSWLRADVTYEYRYSSFSAHDELSYNDGVAAPNTAYSVLRNNYRGTMASFVGLVNGYIDLGTWNGLTPYVGAGIGVANQRLTGLTDNGYNNLYAGPGSFSSSSTSGSYANASKTSLAYALMAGVSYDINHRLKLEFGYRYLNVGTAVSGAPHCNAGGPGLTACNNKLQFARSGSHDIRMGMRWMLSDMKPAPMIPVEPAPLVRKY